MDLLPMQTISQSLSCKEDTFNPCSKTQKWNGGIVMAVWFSEIVSNSC